MDSVEFWQVYQKFLIDSTNFFLDCEQVKAPNSFEFPILLIHFFATFRRELGNVDKKFFQGFFILRT